MKYLIYELFSGVGLCNQLFSLETAVYLACIMKRKLILIIKNPLCHCGKASWEFGYLLNFFETDFYRYLPNGFEVYYRTVPQEIHNQIKASHHFQSPRFSQAVFVDKHLDTQGNQDEIKKFCHMREHTVFDIRSFDKHESIFINKSNASRCFYNFYTSNENYELMYDICRSIKFKAIYHELATKLYSELPRKKNNYNIFLHFRFGDMHKDQSFIERSNNIMISNLSEYLQSHQTNLIKPNVYALVDNKKNEMFNKKMRHYKLSYIDSITKDAFSKYLNENNMLFFDAHSLDRHDVATAIIEMLMASMSDEFIGYSSSTFSHYIQYLRYINHRSYYNYSNLQLKNLQYCRLMEVKDMKFEWNRLGFNGGHPVAWHYFFNPFPERMSSVQLTVQGKSDGFGSQFHACLSLIAYCHYKGYEYIHSPFYRMTHNDENKKEFHDYMNGFVNLEHKFKKASFLSNNEVSRLHKVKEGYFVHGSLHPEFFYTPEVLKKIRECYYSCAKPNLEDIYESTNYNVAIHIRRGDVNQHKYPSRFTSNQDYIKYMSKIQLPKNAMLHIFSEGNEKDFQDLKKQFSSIRLHLSENIQKTFHSLVRADLLIMSKSSFCYSAALLNENKVDGYFIKSWWHKPLKEWV